jgi:hypothetical protein
LSAAAAPFRFDRDAGEAAALELADQRAELAGKLHIGLELGRVLGRQRRHVQRIGDAAVDEIIRHLLGDLDGDIDLGFGGRGAEMGRGDEAGVPNSGLALAGSSDEHVERRARRHGRCRAPP